MIYKRKKKAFAFIESLVILMFVILLVTISLNLINLNYLKSQTYKSYSDKKSLSLEEEFILKEINIQINKETEDNENNIEIKNDEKYNYNIGKYKLIEKDNKYYLVKKLSNSNVYIELKMKKHNSKKIFVPTYYKTKNIVGDKLWLVI